MIDRFSVSFSRILSMPIKIDRSCANVKIINLKKEKQTTMNDRPTRRMAIFALTAAMLLTHCMVKAESSAPSPTPPPAPAIELGAPFADNAILQREMDLPVWGWSDPSIKVTVEFAGQKKTAETGADGKWMIKLSPLKSSDQPAEMVITASDGKKVVLKNLLVGEVWMASGQSNMQWIASKSDASHLIAALAAKGENPPIREFAVQDFFACMHPIEHAKGAWNVGDFGNYSAVAFAFAHKLHAELGVPIGILNCSFSQTSIEAWTPRNGFRDGTDAYTRSLYQRILETDPSTAEHKKAWDAYYQGLMDASGPLKKGQTTKALPAIPGNLNGNRDASWLFNARINPVIPFAIRGCIWNQGYANINGGLTYYDNLHSLIRGWRECWKHPELPVYFHQFYCPDVSDKVTLDSTSQMRLGTWLARDIPHTGMASQIDVTGAIHYRNKTVPAQRLALHALKNQYGKDIVADGPMFKSYKVDGDKVTVDFDFAKGGLVVAETGTNAASGFSNPKIIENGESKVTLFYVADENRVWYRANLMIAGEKVQVSSPKVKSPRGVAYATGGAGFAPNLYNHALLPMTPFIYYDHKMITAKNWLDNPIKIDGFVPDASESGKLYEYRKMPLLSTQFDDNAVLQAGVPVTIWGSAVHDWGYEANGKAEIKFSFAGIEKTIPVTPGMKEWQVVLPPMPASADPNTLKVTFTINGEIAHERIRENIVFGDVWYVAAPDGLADVAAGAKSSAPVRMMTRRSKTSSSPGLRRFSVSVSTSPKNRGASIWEDANGFAAALGNRIGSKTGKPVGIIFMQCDETTTELKQWIPAEALGEVPSLAADDKELGTLRPGSPHYATNVKRYIEEWKTLWGKYVPEMISNKRVPDGAPWGGLPSMEASVTTTAGHSYNALVHSFTPTNLRGVIFLSGKSLFEKDQGAHFGEQFSALANSWKELFGGDPHFYYCMPNKDLAPRLSKPQNIKGGNTGFEIGNWSDGAYLQELIEKAATADR
jgi:sialate O-acetylesterase